MPDAKAQRAAVRGGGLRCVRARQRQQSPKHEVQVCGPTPNPWPMRWRFSAEMHEFAAISRTAWGRILRARHRHPPGGGGGEAVCITSRQGTRFKSLRFCRITVWKACGLPRGSHTTL